MRIINEPKPELSFEDLNQGDTFTFGGGIFPRDVLIKTTECRAVYLATGAMPTFTPTKRVSNVNMVECRPIGSATLKGE